MKISSSRRSAAAEEAGTLPVDFKVGCIAFAEVTKNTKIFF